MTGTDWVRFARWSLGEITNDEYADALVVEGEDKDSPSIKMLRQGFPKPQLAEPCVFCGEPVYGPAPYGPPHDDDGYRHDRCSEAHYRSGEAMNTGRYNTVLQSVPRTKPGATTVKAIAESAGLSPSTVRKYVATMVERGEVAEHRLPGYQERYLYSQLPFCDACSHHHDADEPCRCPECGQDAIRPGGTCGRPHWGGHDL